MGLFSKDSKSPKDTGANPHIAQTTTGFASLKDAAAAAPDRTDDSTPQRRGKKTAAAGQPQAITQTAEEKKKEELKKQAMEQIGKQICAELAAVPYDTWAFLVDDAECSLTPEEKKDLTEKYFLLAQTLEPDFSSPWFLIIAVSLQNMVLMAKRLKMRKEKKAQQELERNPEGGIPSVQ